jgi:hypothetical protein
MGSKAAATSKDSRFFIISPVLIWRLGTQIDDLLY